MVAPLVVSACVVLPAPSLVRTDDKLALEGPPIPDGGSLLIVGRNAEHPARGGILSTSGDGLFGVFVAGCKDAVYQQDTISRLGESVYAANRTVLGPKSLADKMGNLVIPKGMDWKPPDILLPELSEAHVHYLAYVTEHVDSTIHVPLWIPLFGVAACEHTTSLEARLWEVPSGRYLGLVSTSAHSEFLILSYLVTLGFEPHTQESATEKLADELLRKLAAEEPNRTTAALSN
jgi:hypothetical protein